MRKAVPAADPESYIAALGGWQVGCVERLRRAVLAAAGLRETVKWGNLVYVGHGPVLLIRAEDRHVLFGFWRGSRLREIQPGDPTKIAKG